MRWFSEGFIPLTNWTICWKIPEMSLSVTGQSTAVEWADLLSIITTYMQTLNETFLAKSSAIGSYFATNVLLNEFAHQNMNQFLIVFFLLALRHPRVWHYPIVYRTNSLSNQSAVLQKKNLCLKYDKIFFIFWEGPFKMLDLS